MSTGPPRVGVVGAGTLGSTVVRAALAAGSPVTVLVRGDDARAGRREAELAAAVAREAARGRLAPAAVERCLRRLRCTSRAADLAGCDVVVESVPESVPLKREVIAAIESVVAEDALIASSTSSIPAAVLAEGARHPERVVVAHYVWPAHRIRLVEVAFHGDTDPRAVHRLGRMLDGQGKRVLWVADRPGFLITRALFAYWDAAVGLLREGCPPGSVDDALTGFGCPMGPFAVMQATGLDSVASIVSDLAPHLDVELPSLDALARAVATGADRVHDGGGALGAFVAALPRRSGDAAALDPAVVVDRTVGALTAEIDRAVTEGVVRSWQEAGRAVEEAYGFPATDGGLARWWLSARERLRPTPAAPYVPAAVPLTPVGSPGGEESRT